MTTRRFEMVEGGSKKFWEITIEGSSFTVRYGRIGTGGQSQEKSFADATKAAAAAAKLVAEKTGKGYVETSPANDDDEKADASPETSPPETSPPETSAPARLEEATPSEPKAKKEKPAKATKKKEDAVAAPELVLGDKTIGARALANAAQRFAESTDEAGWAAAALKLPGASYQARTVLAHLLQHGLFVPTLRSHVVGQLSTLFELPTDALARVLAAIPEDAIAGTGLLVNQYGPLVGRILRAEKDIGAVALPPTLAKLALVGRAFSGGELSNEDGAVAFAFADDMLRFGANTIAFDDEYGRAIPVTAQAMARGFERMAGAHWVRRMPSPERLPTEVAVVALEGEDFSEVVRALSLFNKDFLRTRTEPPARFFEAAEAVGGQKASFLRVAGVARAEHPDQIPSGAELAIAPVEVGFEAGFARLGTARLDAWAAHWLAKDDPHQQIRIPLERLAFGGAPFGDAMRDALLGEPRRHANVDAYDLYAWVQHIRQVTADGAPHVLRVALDKVRRREAEDAPAEIVRGLRLLVAAAVGALRPELDVPAEADAFVRVSDGTDYDTKNLVRRAVHRLPLLRSEQAVARNASELADPYEELTYARAGASDAAQRRYARLLASGRQNETMWLHVRSRALAPLGPGFGAFLADALSGETLSETFFTRLETVIDPAALAHVREVVGRNALDLAAEMKKLVAELGGEKVVVYALAAGKPGRSLSRLSRPAGYAPEDVPRARGRKLMHALTVDLNDAPELASRFPGARTVSIWIKGWSEHDDMPQAIITRTEAQIAAHPITEDAAELELLRLEVPAAAFGREPTERAQYARRLLYQRPGHLLGGPIWLQDGPWGVDPKFVAQFDERIAVGANFGDMGIGYSFEDRALWQCH